MVQSDTVAQDEVDLLELLQALWKKKGFILLIAIMAVSASILYFFFHTPVYEAKITLGPPISSDIKAFNLRSAPAEAVNISEAYTTFRMTLFSDTTMQAFKVSKENNSPQPSLQENGLVSITLRPESMGRYLVVARGVDAENTAKQAENFVHFVHERSLDELNAAQAREIAATKMFLEKKIQLIQNRENHSDKQYVTELNTLKEQYDFLNNIRPVTDNVVLAKSYGNVIVSNYSFDAKRLFLFSSFGGLFLGVMIVVILHIRQHLNKLHDLNGNTTL
jgi:LPS O-antigen subunit length determinant protein (WzzB/FepE family)